MAESDNEQTPQKPPKLRIDRGDDEEGLKQAEDPEKAKKISTDEQNLFGETTRINLGDAEGGPALIESDDVRKGESTTRIDLPEDAKQDRAAREKKAKKDTSRIDVSSAEPPSPDVLAKEKKEKKAKKDTDRVDVASARPAEEADEGPHDTVPMEPAPGQTPHDTERIPAGAEQGPHDTDKMAPAAAGPHDTEKMKLAETGPHDTDKMQPATPSETKRIDLARTVPAEGEGHLGLNQQNFCPPPWFHLRISPRLHCWTQSNWEETQGPPAIFS